MTINSPLPRGTIEHVLTAGSSSQVVPPIVCLISVDMVDIMGRECTCHVEIGKPVGVMLNLVDANLGISIRSSASGDCSNYCASISRDNIGENASLWAVVKDRFKVFLSDHTNLGQVPVEVMRQMSTVLTIHPLRLGAGAL